VITIRTSHDSDLDAVISCQESIDNVMSQETASSYYEDRLEVSH
jgi:hypothetical protein